MMKLTSEFTVNVDRDALLAKLQTNRGQHGEQFQKAMEGYVKLTIQELEDKLAAIREGREINRFLVNVAPEDHTSDYDNAIQMLKWATDDEIELTQTQFQQYVQDDWGWKQAWITSNTSYLQA